MPSRGGKKEWEIVFTPEAERWYMGLSAANAEWVDAAINQLRRLGPNLGRPRPPR